MELDSAQSLQFVVSPQTVRLATTQNYVVLHHPSSGGFVDEGKSSFACSRPRSFDFGLTDDDYVGSSQDEYVELEPDEVALGDGTLRAPVRGSSLSTSNSVPVC